MRQSEPTTVSRGQSCSNHISARGRKMPRISRIAAMIISMASIVPLWGQAVFYQGQITTINNTAPVQNFMYPMLALPGASVAICNYPATGYSSTSNCTNYATTYTSQSEGTSCSPPAQVVWPNGSTCEQYADTQGNFGVWTNGGHYQYTACTNFGCAGPYDLVLPLPQTSIIPDSLYASFSSACAAAVSSHTTLYLGSSWTGLSTQTCGAAVFRGPNGSVQPASGQTITFTGNQITAGANKWIDTSLGGSVAFTGLRSIPAEWFGAVAIPTGGSCSGNDSTIALQQATVAAVNSLTSNNGVTSNPNISLQAGYYCWGSPIAALGTVILTQLPTGNGAGVRLIGAGSQSTILAWTGSATQPGLALNGSYGGLQGVTLLDAGTGWAAGFVLIENGGTFNGSSAWRASTDNFFTDVKIDCNYQPGNGYMLGGIGELSDQADQSVLRDVNVAHCGFGAGMVVAGNNTLSTQIYGASPFRNEVNLVVNNTNVDVYGKEWDHTGLNFLTSSGSLLHVHGIRGEESVTWQGGGAGASQGNFSLDGSNVNAHTLTNPGSVGCTATVTGQPTTTVTFNNGTCLRSGNVVNIAGESGGPFTLSACSNPTSSTTSCTSSATFTSNVAGAVVTAVISISMAGGNTTISPMWNLPLVCTGSGASASCGPTGISEATNQIITFSVPQGFTMGTQNPEVAPGVVYVLADAGSDYLSKTTISYPYFDQSGEAVYGNAAQTETSSTVTMVEWGNATATTTGCPGSCSTTVTFSANAFVNGDSVSIVGAGNLGLSLTATLSACTPGAVTETCTLSSAPHNNVTGVTVNRGDAQAYQTAFNFNLSGATYSIRDNAFPDHGSTQTSFIVGNTTGHQFWEGNSWGADVLDPTNHLTFNCNQVIHSNVTNDNVSPQAMSDCAGPNLTSLLVSGLATLQGLAQPNASTYAGKCAMVSGTTCTDTPGGVYTTALCIGATPQGSTPIAASCSYSAGTVTITAASSNSLTWDYVLIGDPN